MVFVDIDGLHVRIATDLVSPTDAGLFSPTLLVIHGCPTILCHKTLIAKGKNIFFQQKKKSKNIVCVYITYI